MSLLNKLKDLVASLEEETKESQEQVLPDVAAEEPAEEGPLEEDTLPFEEVPDYLECTEEESLAIYEQFQSLKESKQKLGALLIDYEIKKGQILTEIAEIDAQLMESLNELRLEYGMPAEEISMQLPNTPEEKVAFVKEKNS